MLKMNGISCEYITEVAKDKVYEENSKAFKCQEYLFGEQSYKLKNASEKVDVIITDSPLLLSIIYNSNHILGDDFNNMVTNVFKSYNNLNYLLKRNHQYENNGRNESESEAFLVRNRIIHMLRDMNENYKIVSSDIQSYDLIVQEIIKAVKEKQNEQ